MPDVKIEASWKEKLEGEFGKSYFQELSLFVRQEIQAGKVIFPPNPLIFNAFALCPFEAVRVVILGQDPYHNKGEAMGLSFSVPQGIKIPPSLKNIYRELYTDLNVEPPTHGDLSKWAKQGVFLLNAILTVEHHRPASHQKRGWENFTDAVIKTLSNERENLVFMLWGNYARGKKSLIDAGKHLVLEAAHPSPLAGGAFFGSKHFSQANDYLKNNAKEPINWQNNP